MKKVSIRLKIVLIIFIVLLAGIGVSTFFSVSNQRSTLLDSERQNLSTNNNILNTVIRNIMLDGEAPLAINTISSLRELPDFEQIEIYRRDGNLAFNDYETLNFVNSYQDEITFPTTPRLDNKTMDDPVFMEVTRTNTPEFVENFEERQIGYFFPILNYKECRGCHGTDEFIRGVAFYQASLASIFTQIADTRNFLVITLIGTGIVIALILVFLMQGIIIRPVIDIGQVVGVVGSGNLDVRAEPRSNDELGTLAEKINSMIAGLKEKRQLEIDNRVIEAKNEENRKYLENINEGLILLNRDFTISDQYSNYLHTLFETGEIAGRPFVDLVYPEEDRYAEERKELADFLRMIFEQKGTEMEMIMSINPLENKTLSVGEKGRMREIVVDVSFQRIFRDGDIENVMVIFEDKTDIVRVRKELEREKVRSESELEHIASILRTGPGAFLEFDADSRKTLDRADQALYAPPEDINLNEIIRDLHSFKGSARYLEFRHISDQAHGLEEDFIRIRDGAGMPDEDLQEDIREKIREIREELDNIEKINDRFKEFAEVLSEEDAAKIALPAFLQQLETMVKRLSNERDKQVRVAVDNRLEDFPFLAKIKNPVIHLARNALDHGIEDTIERLESGKPETAYIEFRFVFENNNYIISVRDDGRGIDFETVRSKAAEKGLLPGDPSRAGDGELLKALFTPGFSTKTDADEISGRGAGLDAVYNEVKNLGGHISVSTQKGKGTKFTIRIPAEGNS